RRPVRNTQAERRHTNALEKDRRGQRRAKNRAASKGDTRSQKISRRRVCRFSPVPRGITYVRRAVERLAAPRQQTGPDQTALHKYQDNARVHAWTCPRASASVMCPEKT